MSLYATEGPGDYEPGGADLDAHPEAAALYPRSARVPYPDVVIRQMWPPRVIDSPGGITLEYFAWEESRVPAPMVEDFNAYLDGVGVMSTFVADVLRDSGVTVPVRVVGNGVEVPDPRAVIEAPELEAVRAFTFLHISSAFPRKGVDVLLRALLRRLPWIGDVTLVLKTFPNPHNEMAAVLGELRADHPDPPDVRWIDRDLDDTGLDGAVRPGRLLRPPVPGRGIRAAGGRGHARRGAGRRRGLVGPRRLRVRRDGGHRPLHTGGRPAT